MRKIEKLGVLFFGYVEIIIGLVTLISLFEARFLWAITKPPAVFAFVFLTSLASLILGAGILKYKSRARKLLIFFSGYVILTKLFIFLGLITLSPAFEVLINSTVKNTVSLIYHFLVIVFFSNKNIKYNFK